jgi:hypothetical protein
MIMGVENKGLDLEKTPYSQYLISIEMKLMLTYTFWEKEWEATKILLNNGVILCGREGLMLRPF